MRLINRVLYANAAIFAIVYWGYIGIMERKMETTVAIAYWGYIGITEKWQLL